MLVQAEASKASDSHNTVNRLNTMPPPIESYNKAAQARGSNRPAIQERTLFFERSFQHRLELTALVQLMQDIAATDELAIDVNLRNGRPV
jgi:hypothetical protein